MDDTLAEISFADPDISRCPFGTYRQLQTDQPVYHDPKTGLFEILAVAEIKQAAADTETFSCLSDRQYAFDAELRSEMARLYETEGFPRSPRSSTTKVRITRGCVRSSTAPSPHRGSMRSCPPSGPRWTG